MHIDWWTLALQAVNVLVLVWLLHRFFYRPLTAIIAKRREAAASMLADAEAARAAVDAEKVGIDATRRGFAAEREKILAEAHRQAQSDRDAMMKEAVAAVDRLRAENEAALALDRKLMAAQMRQQAGALAVDIARRLLQKLPADTIAAGFLEGLRQRVRALPRDSLELLRSAASSQGLQVITAATAGDAIREQCRQMLESALGSRANLSWRTDPELIAGVDIRSDVLVVRNDWRNDLSRIQQELATSDAER